MKRVRVVFLLFGALFVLTLYRLLVVQVLRNSTVPVQKYVRIEKISPLRGEIFDRKGTPLAINRKVYDIYAAVEALAKNEKLQDKLQHELAMKDSTLSAYLSLTNWQRIKSNATEKQKKALREYYPAYLNFEPNWVRYYPHGTSSARILGFVGYGEAGEPKGYVGFEGYFNRELTGLPQLSENESDFLGVPFIGGVLRTARAKDGYNLYTTLDMNVQKMVEQRLNAGLSAFRAKRACAIVAEPYSGEILSASCVPSFDQRRYFEYNTGDFLNPLISSVYEPGSTFKPLVVAMALQEGKVRARTVLEEEGPLQVEDYAVNTWNQEYRDKITVEETLQKSSNVGMVHIIQRLKKKTVEEYLQKLGLRTTTGVELEGEVNSLIKDYQDWYPIDFATISFGQGMAVTPFQLVRAFSTLSNGGYLVKPTLVRKIVDIEGRELPKTSTERVRVWNDNTVQEMKKMLRSTIDKAEAYWPNRPDSYEICGKTGTAQIALKGRYDSTKTIASFIGFLPCNKPKFVAFVMYYEPESSPWGSETAAPTFFNIANDLILYYNIAPSR